MNYMCHSRVVQIKCRMRRNWNYNFNTQRGIGIVRNGDVYDLLHLNIPDVQMVRCWTEFGHQWKLVFSPRCLRSVGRPSVLLLSVGEDYIRVGNDRETWRAASRVRLDSVCGCSSAAQLRGADGKFCPFFQHLQPFDFKQ